MENSRKTWPVDVVNHRIRSLGWLTIVLALAPIFGILLASLIDLLFLTPRYNPWLSEGHPLLGVLLVVAFVAPFHAPYTVLFWLTARGLFRHRPWARVMTLFLTPFAFWMMWASGRGIVLVSLFHLFAEGNRSSNVVMPIVVYSPLTLTSAAYCLFVHLLLWKADVRTAFGLPSDLGAPNRTTH